jgi:hypothetical protein
MANTVVARVLFSNTNSRRYIVHLAFIYDTGNETDVVKVDRSALTTPAGVAPDKIKIASIRWTTQGFTYVKLAWNHTTDDVAMVLTNNGYDNFEQFGNLVDPNTDNDAVTGDIGDLLLSTVGGLSGSSYDITLECVI